jgi:hypothetical protein
VVLLFAKIRDSKLLTFKPIWRSLFGGSWSLGVASNKKIPKHKMIFESQG